MFRKSRPRTAEQDARPALRTLCPRDLDAVIGGFKPGQFTSSSGGGGGGWATS